MAGVKGRSGGARPNTGGPRPGSGRPRKQKEDVVPVAVEAVDMLDMLQKVALGLTEATPLQVRAAIAAVQYTHHKVGDGGKKESKEREAEEVSKGRFAPSEPPKLQLVKR